MITVESVPRSSSAPARWLVGPAVDALFVANVFWPLILLVPQRSDFDGHGAVHFWQLYFVTTPHRWVTLAFVLLDRERLRDRRTSLVVVTLAVVVACLAIRLTTGELTCLLAVDYVWNAWHFAAQHHGVYRVYRRRAAVCQQWTDIVEKWALRGFLLYVILRVAGGLWSQSRWEAGLQQADIAMVALPVALCLRELWQSRALWTGSSVYLTSVCGLYLSLLWAVHAQQPQLVLLLATASALFHATEYLTLVGWTAHFHHSRAVAVRSLINWVAPRWGAVIVLFALLQGSLGWFLDRRFLEAWLAINVVMAFLHYAYDGVIWRSVRRRMLPVTTVVAERRETGS